MVRNISINREEYHMHPIFPFRFRDGLDVRPKVLSIIGVDFLGFVHQQYIVNSGLRVVGCIAGVVWA